MLTRVRKPSPIPRRHVAIVACMDSRINAEHVLGYELGDAHVLRNAGAVVTDDVLRSLILSQRVLQTRSVVILAHTDCGLCGMRDDEFAETLARETGHKPPFTLGGFTNVDQHVRQQLARVQSCLWLPHVHDVRGYVVDVVTGEVRAVAASDGDRPKHERAS